MPLFTMTLKTWLVSLTRPCRPIRWRRPLPVRAHRLRLENLEDRIVPASTIVTLTHGLGGVVGPNAWMGALPDSIPLTQISIPGTTKSAAGPSMENAFLGQAENKLVDPESGVLSDVALAAYLSALGGDAFAATQGGTDPGANVEAAALNATALGLQAGAAGAGSTSALTILDLEAESAGVVTNSLNSVAVATGIDAIGDAAAAASDVAEAAANTNAAVAFSKFANALPTETGNNPANISQQTQLRNAAIASASANTASAALATTAAAAFTAKAAADAAETAADATLLADEAAEAAAVVAEGVADAAAATADAVEAASTAAATAADVAAATADAVAATTVEIPFVDVVTAVAAVAADGVAATLEVEDGVATAADVAANALAAADTAVVAADAATDVAETATVAADTAADAIAETAATAAEIGVKAGDVAEGTADFAFGRVLAGVISTKNSVQTQSLSIGDQLNAGIRSLDIGGTLVNDTINVNNGQYFTGYTLQGVLNEATAFLQANPSETIVLSLTSNEQAPVNSSKSFNTDLTTLLNSTDTAVTGNLTYNQFLYYSPSSTTTPDLGQVRGKIVIIPVGFPPVVTASGYQSGWQPSEVDEGASTVTDAAQLWNTVESNGIIKTDLGNSNTLYRNDLTSAGYSTTLTLKSGVGNVTPLQVAEGVNPLAGQLFRNFSVARTTGIVGIDTTGMTGIGNDNDLIGAIINENNLPILVTSEADTSAPGTLRAALNQANEQDGVNTIVIDNRSVQQIVLTADLPAIDSSLNIGGAVDIDPNGHQALHNSPSQPVIELNLVASDHGQPTKQFSTYSIPLVVNSPGVDYIDQLEYFVDVPTDSPGGHESIPNAGDLRYCVNQANLGVAAGAPVSITFAASLNGKTITLTNGALQLLAGTGTTTIDPTLNGVNQVTVSGDGSILTGTTNSGNGIVTGLSSTSSFFVGMPVSGAGIPAGDTIQTVNPLGLAGEIVLSAPATASATVPLTFGVVGSVFQIAAGTQTVLNGLGITHGSVGGIHNAGTLAVSNCTFTNNSGAVGGGIFNSGTLTVSHCTFADNSATHGGGLTNQGTLTIDNSTFANNSAVDGGGIYHTGSALTVSDCTFSGNSASSDGGGIYINGTPMVVSNCTLFGNSAGQSGGGITNVDGTLVVLSSTLSGNSVTGSGSLGGGIAGTMTLTNTIVAGNSANTGAADPDIQGAVNASVTLSDAFDDATFTEGHNLIGDGTGSSGISNGVNGDQVGTSASPINPELSPPENFGGPTQTMALNPGSPAIGTGDGSVPLPANDQRGEPRTTNGTLDIGAFQTLPPVVLTVVSNNPADGVGPGSGAGFVGDLQYCIQQANAAIVLAASVTINFASSLDGQTITVAGTLTLGGSAGGITPLTINGGNQITLAGVNITGNPAYELLFVSSNGDVTLNGLTLANATAEGVANNGVLTINNCTISGNMGPGIVASAGTLTVNDSTISGNGGSGLFIDNDGNGVTVNDSTISGNSNGGIFFNGAQLTVLNSTVSANVSSTTSLASGSVSNGPFSVPYAAGISATGSGPLVLENSIVAGNSDNGTAADISLYNSAVTDHGYNVLGTVFNSTLDPATVDFVVLPSFAVSTDVISNTPKLAPLADNGGPTQTMALLPGSPALGAGNPLAVNLPATDQRGAPRTTNGTLDIGADENQPHAYAESLDSNGNLTITQEMAGNDNLSFGLSGGNYTFTDSGKLWFDQATGAGAGFISGAGTNSITIPSADVQSISVVLGNGTNVFTFTDSSGASVAPITVNAGTTTGDQVIVNGAVLDSGAVSLTAANIVVNANLSAAGNVSLQANPAGTATGNFVGINVNGAMVQSSGGNVSLQGTGGTGANGFQYGVEIQAGGIVQATGTSGTVTIQGTGGASANSSNYGVYVTGTNTLVTSSGGSVTVSGTGGHASTGVSGKNRGVFVSSGAVTAGAGGTLTIQGTGGSGGSGLGVNYGVEINTNGNVTAGAGGTLTIQGTGGSGGGDNEGVVLEGAVRGDNSSPTTIQGTAGPGAGGFDIGVQVSGTLTSGGGDISVIGTGAASASDDNGILIDGGGTVSVVRSGALALTGTAGDAGSAAISVQPGGSTLTTVGGSLTLTGDSIDLGDPNSVSSTGAGQLFFQPQTASQPIILGGNDTAGSLVFTDGDSQAIANGFSLLTIGSATSTGAIKTTANLTLNSNATIETAGGIALGNALNDSGNTLTLTSGVSISQSAGGITAATLNVSAVAGITLNSANAIGSFHAANSSLLGAISLTNTAATLTITGIFGASPSVTVSNTGNLTTSGAITSQAALGAAVRLTASGDETIGALVATGGSGTITLTAGGSQTINAPVTAYGSVDITLTAGHGQTIRANVSASTGNVTLTANHGATGTGNFIGINVAGGTIQSALGSVLLQGSGGTDSGGKQFGVLIDDGGHVQTTGGSGSVTVEGTGGASAGAGNDGVVISGSGSLVTASGGTVTVEGTGGGTGSGGANYGVSVEKGTVSSASGAVLISGTGGADLGGSDAGVALSGAIVMTTGSGNVTVQGTGGADAGEANDGIDEFAGSTITSGGGKVSVTGLAGGDCQGVFIAGTVTSTGSGSVTVTGTGGSGSAGSDSGVCVGVGGLVTSGSTGAVTVQGTGGNSNDTAGVFVLNGTITSGGSGKVSVQGSSGAASGTANAGVWVSGSQAAITSGGGTVAVVGQTGNGSQDQGVLVQNSGTVTAGGNGAVTIQSSGGTSGGGDNSNVVFTSGPNGTIFTVQEVMLNGVANLQTLANGTVVGTQPLASIASYSLNGASAASNAVILNLANGFFTLPNNEAIHFNGGSDGTNSVQVRGGTLNDANLTYSNGSSGVGTVVDATTNTGLYFGFNNTQFADLSKNNSIGELSFNLPSSAALIALTDNGNGAVSGLSSTNNAVPTTFQDPSSALLLFGGSGGNAINLVRTAATTAVYAVDAGSGHNELTMNFSHPTANDVDFVTASAVDSTLLGGPIYYQSNGGDFSAGGVVISLGSGNDIVSVQSTSAKALTTVQTGNGNNMIFVSSVPNTTSGTLRGLAGVLSVRGGTGNNQLILSNAGATVADTYYVTNNAIAGTVEPFTVYYTGNFSGGVALVSSSLQVGEGNNTFNVLSQAAATPTALYAGTGNSIFNVAVTNSSDYQLTVVGGSGTNTLGVFDTSGGGTATKHALNSMAGTIVVSYLGASSDITYNGVQAVGSNLTIQ